MIQQAIIEGVPFQWVCGDSIYGTSPVFVQTVRELGKWYVVETSCDARVWTTKPKLRPDNVPGGPSHKERQAPEETPTRR